MKKRFVAFLLFIFITISGIQAASPEFKKEKNATLLPITGSDIRYIVLSFKTGSVRDPKGKEGLNFITASLIEENIKKALNEKAPSSGADFQSQSDKEITTFFFKVHKDKFEQAYPIFISGIIKPDMGDDFLQLAKNDAENSRDYIINDSEALSLEELELFIYRAHPYGTPDFGTKKSQKNITTDDVKTFHRKFYTSENYELGVGGFNAEEILKRVKNDLAALPSGKPEKTVIGDPEKIIENKVLIIKMDVTTTAVALGFPLDFTRSDDDYYPLMIANSSFGHHRYMHGILFRELREARGFNYGDYSYMEKFVEGSQDKMPQTRIPREKQYFYVWLRNLADENACFAAKFTLMRLEQMVNNGLSEERFSLMKDFVSNNVKLWDFDPFQKLGYSMDSDFYRTPYFIDYIQKKMDGIKNEDLSSALKKRMGNGNIKMVFVTADPEKMKERLLGHIESPPVYKTTLSPENQKVDEAVLKYDLKLKPEDIEIVNGEDLF